jgi:hypothetical protein
MAGAVSAGAYTAGVVDFLIDALDTLYEAREVQLRDFQDDYSKWTIPAHEINLDVMSGASAGGMTAGIAAAALCERFIPVRSIPDPGARPPNRLYKSWVRDIDISYLLGREDFNGGNNHVRSVLDSTQIDRIADEALTITHPLPAPRAYVSPDLKLVLTVTNLRGVPYAIEKDPGGIESQTNYYADQMQFQMAWDGRQQDEDALWRGLNPFDNSSWEHLRDAAKATGAFPMMLASRVLQRQAREYNRKVWRVPSGSPSCNNGVCECDAGQLVSPRWTLQDEAAYPTVNVDGGVTNNSPFEASRRILSEVNPPSPGGRNPRKGSDADRAVITVAPFPSTASYDPQFQLNPDLLSIAGAVIGAMLTQSRIQGQDIRLIGDLDVFSRFAVAPSIDNPHLNALASSALGAFAGFMAREFRDHDYQLGRRNCQQFLRKHFVLPLDNVVLRQYNLSAATIQRFKITAEGEEGQTFDALPIIPLLGGLDVPVKVDRAQISRSRLDSISSKASGRLKLVVEKLIESKGLGWLDGPVEALWFVAGSKIKDALGNYIEQELDRQELLN